MFKVKVEYSMYIINRMHYKLIVSLENQIRTVRINQEYFPVHFPISLFPYFPSSNIQIPRPFQWAEFFLKILRESYKSFI